MYVTQDEYNVAKQPTRILYSKVVLLNTKFEQVGEITGNVIGTPSFSASSDSDIRRTCSISLFPTDSSFDIEQGNRLWLDKYIQVYMGIRDVHKDEIIWTNMGIYIINDPSRTYSATDNTLSFQASDLMAKLTSMRGGIYSSVDYVIPQGSKIMDIMKATLEEIGITDYYFPYYYNNDYYTVPNDMRISRGSTIYEMFSQLVDLYSNMQIYFDVNGRFVYSSYPYDTSYDPDTPVDATDELWDDVLVSYSVSNDLQNVKNTIYIYGTTHDVGSNYADGGLHGVKNIGLDIAGVDKYTNGMLVGFTVDRSQPAFTSEDKKKHPLIYAAYPYTFNIYHDETELENKNLVTGVKTNSSGEKILSYPLLETNEYYVAKYVEDIDSDGKDNGYFLYLGHLQAQGKAIQKDGRFGTKQVGELAIVLEGGDYDNLYTDSDCNLCADYELYNRCRIYDSVQLECAPIYWLDIYDVVEITLPNKYGKSITARYSVTNISTGDTQSITLTRLYSQKG